MGISPTIVRFANLLLSSQDGIWSIEPIGSLKRILFCVIIPLSRTLLHLLCESCRESKISDRCSVPFMGAVAGC